MVRGGSSPLGRTGKAPRGGAFCWSETVCASVRRSRTRHRRRPGGRTTARAPGPPPGSPSGRGPTSDRGRSSTIRNGQQSSPRRPPQLQALLASAPPGRVLADRAIAIEVELAPKSKPRLDAILQLHLGWIVARKTDAAIYICGDQEGWRRVERVGLYRADKRFRIELLDTIKERTLAAYEQKRVDQAAAA